MNQHTHFDFEGMTPRDRYKILTGTIVPRPIALVTTIDEEGNVNAAPISFFNCLSSDPALLVLGIAPRDDRSPSDTARNIRSTGEFVVNIVSRDMLSAMNVCAIAFPPGVNELAQAKLHPIESTKISVPRIAESPAAFECRRTIILSVSASRDIVLGEVVAAHVRSNLITDRLHTDQTALDAVGRMGGATYAFTSELFDLSTPTLGEWSTTEREAASA